MKTIKVGSVKIKVNAKGKALKTERLKKGSWARIDGSYQQLKKDVTREVNAYCMPFQSKNKIFKGSNGKNTFDPKAFQARSYTHWVYVAKIKGKVVFNDYNYSMTTNGHQSQMRSLLSELGIKIHLEVNMRQGLDSFKMNALEPMYRELFLTEIALKRPNSKPETNKHRRAEIKRIKSDIRKARALGAILSQSNIKALKIAIETDEVLRLENLKKERLERADLLKARRALINKGETFSLQAA